MSETFKTDKGTIIIGWIQDHILWRSETKTSRRSFHISFDEGLRVANEIATARTNRTKSIDIEFLDGVGSINIQIMATMARIAEPPTNDDIPTANIELDQLNGIASMLRVLENADLRSRLQPMEA